MDNNFKYLDFVIRLFVIALLGAWCFVILRPFIGVVLWGIILAIAIFPVFEWLQARLGGRGKLAGTLLILAAIAVIVGPVSIMTSLFADNAQEFAGSLLDGSFAVPPPPEDIAQWPMIGPSVYRLWEQASVNLGTVLAKFEPQIKGLSKTLLFVAANTGLTLVKFLISIIIAGLFIFNVDGLKQSLMRFMTRLSPGQGLGFLKLVTITIRSVTRGVLGIAIIQTLLVGLGLIVADIPAAGLLIFICLLLTIVQIGPGIVIIGTLIYAWSTMPAIAAFLLTLWLIPVSLVDNVLKPMLMARGLPVPMVVILMGVIGGTLSQGILGLFIGPVVLSLGYELLKVWIDNPPSPAAVLPSPEEP